MSNRQPISVPRYLSLASFSADFMYSSLGFWSLAINNLSTPQRKFYSFSLALFNFRQACTVHYWPNFTIIVQITLRKNAGSLMKIFISYDIYFKIPNSMLVLKRISVIQKYSITCILCFGTSCYYGIVLGSKATLLSAQVLCMTINTKAKQVPQKNITL